MSHSIQLSDEAYERLQQVARGRGMTLRQMLEAWDGEVEAEPRATTAAQIRELNRRLAAKYGIMPDSVPLIREDRER